MQRFARQKGKLKHQGKNEITNEKDLLETKIKFLEKELDSKDEGLEKLQHRVSMLKSLLREQHKFMEMELDQMEKMNELLKTHCETKDKAIRILTEKIYLKDKTIENLIQTSKVGNSKMGALTHIPLPNPIFGGNPASGIGKEMTNLAKTLQFSKNTACNYCGGELHYDKKECPAKGSKCDKCGKKNHLSKMCKNTVCYHCGGELHKDKRDCPARGAKCGKCNKKDHWTEICRTVQGK